MHMPVFCHRVETRSSYRGERHPHVDACLHAKSLNRCSPDQQNQFDSIDLSDNAIVRLEGFPKLLRLTTLLLNNNKIVRIAKHLEGALG
jgi:hypothetical protein